MHVTFKVAGI